jgi:hypothetical protein
MRQITTKQNKLQYIIRTAMQNMQQIICWSDWKSIETRNHVHQRYLKTNKTITAFALHILSNRQEYGSPETYRSFIKSMQ